jgi:hypothetical protein
MSERGSFCTEYIYCQLCFQAAKRALVKDSKFLKGIEVPMWTGGDEGNLPIVAGKIGGSYPDEELLIVESDIFPEMAQELCHNIRVVVLPDSGKTVIYDVHPDGTWDKTIHWNRR